MALLIGVGLLGWFIRPLIHRAYAAAQARRRARHDAWLQSADYAWRQIPAQIDAKPAQLSARYLWTRRSRMGLKLSNFGPRLQTLRRARYGRAPTEDQALRQLKDFLATLHSQAKRKTISGAFALRPLNPVQEKDFP